MKKIIIVLFTLLLCMSCASLFPGKSYNKIKLKKVNYSSVEGEASYKLPAAEFTE